MASPLSTGKKSVNLAGSTPRVSKIRRDPPRQVKEIAVRDPRERDRQDAIIGILAFTFAILVIILAFAIWSGWSPRQYSVYF